MSNLLFLQIWSLRTCVFPNKSYKVLKWQIWKCIKNFVRESHTFYLQPYVLVKALLRVIYVKKARDAQGTAKCFISIKATQRRVLYFA